MENKSATNFTIVKYQPHRDHLFIRFYKDKFGNIFGSSFGDSIFDTDYRIKNKKIEAKMILKDVYFEIKYLKYYDRPVALTNEQLLRRKLAKLDKAYKHNKAIFDRSLFSGVEMEKLNADYALAVKKAKQFYKLD